MKQLSKEQMKQVVGGGWSTCTWTYSDGSKASVPCAPDAETCQTASDASCLKNDKCTDVDCR